MGNNLKSNFDSLLFWIEVFTGSKEVIINSLNMNSEHDLDTMGIVNKLALDVNSIIRNSRLNDDVKKRQIKGLENRARESEEMLVVGDQVSAELLARHGFGELVGPTIEEP
jgi:hypothetical protein